MCPRPYAPFPPSSSYMLPSGADMDLDLFNVPTGEAAAAAPVPAAWPEEPLHQHKRPVSCRHTEDGDQRGWLGLPSDDRYGTGWMHICPIVPEGHMQLIPHSAQGNDIRGRPDKSAPIAKASL